MRYFTIGILIIALLFSCKSKKEVAEKETAELSKAPVQEATSDVLIEDLSAQEEQELKMLQAEISDSAIIRIQRTACFGRCPIYTMTIYPSGFTEYNGKKFTDKIGFHSTTLSKEKINKILSMAEEIQFFQMNTFYDNKGVTDLPSTITTIRKEEEMKTVFNRYEGPKELRIFENFIDSTIAGLEWEKEEEIKND